MFDSTLRDILLAIWFFLPAGLANVTPVLATKIPGLKRLALPLDLGLSIGGKRILGNNKTWRGIILGVLTAILITCLEVLAFNNSVFLRENLTLNYNQVDPVLLGTLLGFGSLVGDSLKSFFKRRTNISPGKSWFPFDQIDYIIGGIVFSLFYVQLPLWVYVWIVLIWFSIHPISTVVGYWLKLKDSPI